MIYVYDAKNIKFDCVSIYVTYRYVYTLGSYSYRCFPCRFGCYVVKPLTIHVFELGKTIFTFNVRTIGFIYIVAKAESLQCSIHL